MRSDAEELQEARGERYADHEKMSSRKLELAIGICRGLGDWQRFLLGSCRSRIGEHFLFYEAGWFKSRGLFFVFAEVKFAHSDASFSRESLSNARALWSLV